MLQTDTPRKVTDMEPFNQPQPQRMSELLASVAPIASVKATCLGLARTDKQASVDADRAHNAMQGAGRVAVSRLAGSEARVRESAPPTPSGVT